MASCLTPPNGSRYGILFEPVRIGPVTAPNRFYQTPHATGLGSLKPQASAALRGIKAEGGWGVVCTEYCSIHPSSDDTPYGFLTLWDEDDVKALSLIADAIHAHGSLAAVELWHGGNHSANRYSREPLLSPSGRPGKYAPTAPFRAMDKSDIRTFRGWQRQAALRAKKAGFDIVYVYAGHDYLPFQFLSPRTNTRNDEYGGSLENRTRLIREMIEDTKDAVGGSCGVAVRLAVDELHGPGGITSDGEGRDALALLAELPDLWDVNVAGSLGNDSRSARFSEEGFQEEHVAFVKSLTSKPVVSVGRFTSPDRMVSQIRRGIQDFIGAARPSIADPFLPQKIGKAARTRSVNASAATSAARPTTRASRSAARKTPRWARSGEEAGTPRSSRPGTRAKACWWWAVAPPDSRPHWHLPGAAMTLRWPRHRRPPAGGCCMSPGCPGSPPGSECATTACT
jgi:dimethylamine/trimethylamine dehydrogenase